MPGEEGDLEREAEQPADTDLAGLVQQRGEDPGTYAVPSPGVMSTSMKPWAW